MNIFLKILVLCLLIPTQVFNNQKDTNNFHALINKYSSAWKALPNNIKYYITFSVVWREKNVNGTHSNLSQHLGGIADYIEYLEPKSYAANKHFWTGLYVLFSRDTMQLDRHERRLSIQNKSYLDYLPTRQQENFSHLANMLHRRPTGSSLSIPAHFASAAAQFPTATTEHVDWTAGYNKYMKKAAEQCCTLLKQNKKNKAKQAVLTYACLLNTLTKPISKLDSHTIYLYESAFNVLTSNKDPDEWPRISLYHTCGITIPAMTQASELRHNDGQLKLFSVTPIIEQLQQENEPQAIHLTVKLIEKVAEQVKEKRPSLSKIAGSKPSSADRKRIAVTKPASRPSSRATSVRKSSPTQTSPSKKPRREFLTLEDVGQDPLTKFVTQ